MPDVNGRPDANGLRAERSARRPHTGPRASRGAAKAGAAAGTKAGTEVRTETGGREMTTADELTTTEAPPSEVEDFAQEIADQVESFLIALREIARAEDLATGVPMLLLEVSQLMLAGGRLGAISDVVPVERFEPDTGPDPDLDELRERLGYLLTDVDVYTEVFDPYAQPPELLNGRLSDDLAGIAAALVHGLKHHRAGRIDEALWWWQFSYLSSWGAEAGAVLRALHSVIAHARLDSAREDSA
ncbi:DUF5063 domain-containing protein [Actinopolymorpha sp. NPDC004070]|uniref:DUF5063 domain-containing protein n=1 Tax=Actinopolymorpha sp. NPDC004070 TaxID=3154548 RepID=UPI0033AF01C4